MSKVVTSSLQHPSSGVANLVLAADGTVSGPGSSVLVAVKSAIFTGTQSASVGNGGNVAVTDLTITHALADASHKLILIAYTGTVASSRGRGQVGIAFHDGTNFIGIGDADGSNMTRVASGGHVTVSANTLVTSMPSIHLVHSPGDTSSRTYEVRIVSITDLGTSTLFVNRPDDARNITAVQRSSSSFTLMEVKV